MDMGSFNSSPVTQTDLMRMMLQMEELIEFSEPPPSTEFPVDPLPPFHNSPTAPTTPLFAGLQHSITVTTPATLDPLTAPLLFANPTLGEPSLDHRPTSVPAMREMMFHMAAMQPIHIDPESVKPPKRRNVRISKEPQSVAARLRRERISERIRILQRLVPGGTKMDTASMLDEAILYVKFLKTQVQSLERAAARQTARFIGLPPPEARFPYSRSYSCYGKMPQLPDQRLMNSAHMLS